MASQVRLSDIVNNKEITFVDEGPLCNYAVSNHIPRHKTTAAHTACSRTPGVRVCGITVCGERFNSVRELADEYCISIAEATKRLQSDLDKWSEWKYSIVI